MSVNGIWKQATLTLGAVVLSLLTAYFVVLQEHSDIKERLARIETKIETLSQLLSEREPRSR